MNVKITVTRTDGKSTVFNLTDVVSVVTEQMDSSSTATIASSPVEGLQSQGNPSSVKGIQEKRQPLHKEIIDKLVDEIDAAGNERKSLYFKFSETVAIGDITYEDLEYIAELCNYKSKWVDYKYQEIQDHFKHL